MKIWEKVVGDRPCSSGSKGITIAVPNDLFLLKYLKSLSSALVISF